MVDHMFRSQLRMLQQANGLPKPVTDAITLCDAVIAELAQDALYTRPDMHVYANAVVDPRCANRADVARQAIAAEAAYIAATQHDHLFREALELQLAGAVYNAVAANEQAVLDALIGPDWPAAVNALVEAMATLPDGATSTRPEQHGLQWGALWHFLLVEGQVHNRLRNLNMPGHQLLHFPDGLTEWDILWEHYVSNPSWTQLPPADLLVSRWRKGSRPRLRPVLDPAAEAARLAEEAAKAKAGTTASKPPVKHRAAGF